MDTTAYEFVRVLVTVSLIVPATLLPIINPLGNAPIFLSMADSDERLVATMSRRVAVNCLFLLLGALLVGGYVIDVFGLSIPIVRVGGGLVVAATGWRLLHEHGADDIQSSVAHSATTWTEPEIARRSFFPISFPLTVGPGSIATAITLGARRPEQAVQWVPALLGAGIGLLATAAVIFFSYRYSGWLLRTLGDIGTMVLLRLAAFILLCIGIEIIWSGWAELARLP